ncbi:glycosyl hydrolase family 18 protein [Cohnella yongneupensis]|uniref:Glycosyl hydrolase family 18 protein n=1 Tax=Cohnella yongneupensis TaxID=425006 RepID=A0ABW0R3R6_9BACL
MKYSMIILSIVTFALLLSCGSPAQRPPADTSRLKQESTAKPKLIPKITNRIVMGWNAFGTTETYIKQSSVSKTLNVVSPRWFKLDYNYKHLVISEADARFVKWAHNSGKQVWPLFGNSFDTKMTDFIISNPIKSQKTINQLRDIMVKYEIDGVNVDFENMDVKNKAHFVNFIRLLKAALQPYGMQVTVDVTRENPDPNWSGCYDRRGLGKVADFIVMMGYNEDLGGGGHIGSVASLPWVEQGIQLLLKDVPANKVLLAIPFYTREWVTDLNSGKAYGTELGLVDVDKIIANYGLIKKWDPTTKQNYVEYIKGIERHQIWLEDENSVKLRMDIINKYKLKGAAAWWIGQETPEIWQVISSF